MKTNRRGRLLFGAGLGLLLVSPCLGACSDGAATTSQAAAGREDRNVIAAAGPIELGKGSSRVALAATTKSAGKTLAALGPGQHLSLVVRDLRTAEQPGVLYHLYLGLPVGREPAKDDPRYVGALNFYNATGPGLPANPSIFQSYDITAAVRALRDRGLLSEPLTVTLVPAGDPAAGAKPVIGRIELAVQ